MKLLSALPIAAFLAGVTAQAVDLDIFVRNSYRLVNVSLGSPPVTHSLLFDTGSSSLWLVDASCGAQCPNTSGASRTPYNGSTSSTSIENKSVNSSIDYLGGGVTGFVASDIATIGKLSFNQTFAPAVWSTWQNLPADGFLGLASSTIGIPGTTSMFENMLLKGIAALPRFGIYLGSGAITMTNASPVNNGVLTLGGSRESEFAAEPVKFVDVTQPFEVYKVPLQSWNQTSKGNPDVNIGYLGYLVVDTGSDQFSVPQQFIEQIYSATPWSYHDLMNGTRPLCADFTDDWSVSFTIGAPGAEQTFTVPGSQLGERGYQDDEHCFPPFNPFDSNNVIVGALWMRNFYSVFDFGSNSESKIRVGFAPLQDEFRPKL